MTMDVATMRHRFAAQSVIEELLRLQGGRETARQSGAVPASAIVALAAARGKATSILQHQQQVFDNAVFQTVRHFDAVTISNVATRPDGADISAGGNLPGLAVPDNGCFSLIGNANCGNFGSFNFRFP